MKRTFSFFRHISTSPQNSSPVLSHLDSDGRARMVDVSSKRVSNRTATARARVLMPSFVIEEVERSNVKKGDVLTIAQIAGICGAKKTSDLIPLCHNIPISKIDLTLRVGGGGLRDGSRTNNSDESSTTSNSLEPYIDVVATVSSEGKTGVEMEALTAVSVASLTIYDMCKAMTHDIVIADVCLLAKDGGKAPYRRKENRE